MYYLSKANIYNQFYYLGHQNFYKYHPLRFPVIGYLENFKEDILNGSFFDDKKLIIISRVTDKIFSTIDEIIKNDIR